MDELPPLFGPGQHLGRYELLQRLAVGGMAEVYLAYSVGPGDFRKVAAIKRLLPQHALDPQLLRMFLDEARLMARLSHPNIPHVTDVDDGHKGDRVDVPYFVMEYVHGTDLRGVLNAAAGPLPIEHALAIAMAVAAGLHHAHEHRGASGQRLEIVHRDVSPSNILISFDGAVKVTDFGVAKWTEQKSFTHQGQLKGKFAHMSPEQCRGEVLDRRSDVFALGTLLYEMTTGDPPFVAESEYELLTQIVSREAPPPQRAGQPYPADLAAIVMRSLGRAREDRYESAQQMQLALEAFAREHRLMVSPVGLAGYLESLFSARVTEWREDLASGKTLADHLERRERKTGNGHATANGQTPAKDMERTATDAFAVAPGIATTGTLRKAPASTARPTPNSSVRQALAVAGVAALAVALLLVATELTSRWQRVARPAMSGVPMVDPAAPAAITTVSATPTTAQFPPPALPPTPPRASAAGASGASATSAAASIPARAGVERRGRDAVGTGRPARREAATVAARSASSASAPASTAGASPPPVAQPSAAAPALLDSPLPAASPAPPERQRPPQPVPPASTERPAPSPPPTPVKVWDPDSPVPP